MKDGKQGISDSRIPTARESITRRDTHVDNKRRVKMAV